MEALGRKRQKDQKFKVISRLRNEFKAILHEILLGGKQTNEKPEEETKWSKKENQLEGG